MCSENYPRTRMDSPFLLSRNFGIWFSPLANTGKKRVQKWNQSWLLPDLTFIPWRWLLFLLFKGPAPPPHEKWWNSINTVHASSRSGSSRGGHWAWSPATSRPPSCSPHRESHLPWLFCCVRGSGALALMVQVLPVWPPGLLNPLLLCLDHPPNRQSC